jgi:acyl-CoA synthetase (AMP-forming)/AMP-acid ligase II
MTTGADLPVGEIGGIQVKGPNVFKGYWRMPEKTAEEFTADGYFKTGDVGKVDERGYVTIVGRSKDLIISGGYNVYPAEIEGYINELPGVAESAVVGVPHPDFGEVGVAPVVIAKAGCAVLEPRTAIIAESEGQAGQFQDSQALLHAWRARAAAQHHGQGSEKPCCATPLTASTTVCPSSSHCRSTGEWNPRNSFADSGG